MSENIKLNDLPLGLISFSNIRTKHKIYVDKTDLIFNIADNDTPTFFSRPRRFGKTLLINTLESLFKDGLKYFHGLKIEKLWKDTTYKVAHFDFSSFASNNSEIFEDQLRKIIIRKFGMKGIVSQRDEVGIKRSYEVLDEICEKLVDNSTVLLIDEYDAPLIHHINEQDELEKIKSILSNFYSTIKQYTDKFRLIFITGVTRVSHISIFSSFNNLIDLSLNEEFNSLLGFTQSELKQFFDPLVENAAKILNIDKSELYQRLEQYYDGFQFALNANETVYNPWSILSFLRFSKTGFTNYWFQSAGSSTIIMEYLKKSDSFDLNDYNDIDIFIRKDMLLNRYDITNIPMNVLLFQSGYLTIRKISNGVAKLVFPNTEVKDSILKLYLIANNLAPDIKFINEIENLTVNIDQKNITAIVNTFNAILNECVSVMGNIFKDERSIRDIIYAALPQKIDLQKMKERETVKGRSDLEILTRKTHMVIEFKRTNSKRDETASLQEAVEQLQSKQYGIGAFQQLKLYRVAMVISTEKKAILHDFCREIG